MHGLHGTYDMLRNQLGRTHPMVLVVEEAQVEAQFGLFGYSANLDAR